MSVDIRAADDVRATIEKRIEVGLDKAMDRLLEQTEQAQVLTYTRTAHPTPPPGSTYERTFTLRRASKKRRPGRTLRNMVGEWYIDESIADYGPYVIGSEAEQAEIHRGRWKGTEDVEQELEQAAPAIIEEELKGV